MSDGQSLSSWLAQMGVADVYVDYCRRLEHCALQGAVLAHAVRRYPSERGTLIDAEERLEAELLEFERLWRELQGSGAVTGVDGDAPGEVTVPVHDERRLRGHPKGPPSSGELEEG